MNQNKFRPGDRVDVFEEYRRGGSGLLRRRSLLEPETACTFVRYCRTNDASLDGEGAATIKTRSGAIMDVPLDTLKLSEQGEGMYALINATTRSTPQGAKTMNQDKFQPGDRVDVFEEYIQGEGGVEIKPLANPELGCYFVRKSKLHSSNTSGLVGVVRDSITDRVFYTPYASARLSILSDKVDASRNPDAAAVKLGKGDTPRHGDMVSATREYVVPPVQGFISLRDKALHRGTFLGWAKWSGMGEQFVAEVRDPSSGETCYVPRTDLFVYTTVKQAKERLDNALLKAAEAKVPRPILSEEEFRGPGAVTPINKKEIEIDADIANLESLLTERRLRRAGPEDLLTDMTLGMEGFQRVSDEYVNHPLFPVFMQAIEQATHGKGKRHGGNITPFLGQPWAHYVKLHGRGFLTGQAAKKLEEAASTREGKPFIEEIYGAMVYLGMSIIHQEEKGGVITRKVIDPASVYETKGDKDDSR